MSLATRRGDIVYAGFPRTRRATVTLRDVDVSQFEAPRFSYTVPTYIPPRERRGTGWIVFAIIFLIIVIIIIAFIVWLLFFGGARQLGITGVTPTESPVSTLNEQCVTKPCVNPFICSDERVCKSNLRGPCTVNSDCEDSNAVCSQGQCRVPIFGPCDQDNDCVQGLSCIGDVCS